MGKKKSAAVSVKSTSKTTTTSKSIGSSDSSSLLRSAFAPTSFQLHLFASVIQSFESQQLRIHDTTNGQLRQQHAVSAREELTCLSWGRYGSVSKSPNKKKRKRGETSSEDVVVAYGTNQAEICMFLPAQGQVVSTLKNGHEGKILDFQFTPENNAAWSLGEDHKLVQWNLKDDTVTRTVTLTDSAVSILSIPSTIAPQIFCASVTPLAVHLEEEDVFRIDTFDAFKNPVQVLLRPEPGSKDRQDLLIAADNERYLNMYDTTEKKIARTLIASGNIESASLSRPVREEDQVLIVLTRDGIAEVFTKPFSLPSTINGDVKSQRKSLTRKADATIKLMNDKTNVPISAAYVDGPNVIICSLSGGIDPTFQKVRWEDEGNGQLLFSGIKEIQRIQSQSTTNSATMNGAKNMGKMSITEDKTVVSNGSAPPGSQSAPVEIISDDDDDEDEADKEDANIQQNSDAESNSESDAEMADADDGIEPAELEEETEPSFGEQLAAKHPEVITISDVLSASDKALSKSLLSRGMTMPSGMSLGTVLTQSLRTNDQSLLETCLHVSEESIIRNTLVRLDSSLAANLLTKLAERLADRPGRWGHLLIWVQYAMIAHGGAIASQAGVASKLRTLYQVLSERSRILPQLQLLQGKLNMMTAQQAFRQEHMAARQRVDDAPAILISNGDNWSSDEDDVPKKKKAKPTKSLDTRVAGSESSDEDMPMANGDFHTDEESGSRSDSDVSDVPITNGIIDNEAELSEGSDDSSASGDESEDDEEEADSELEAFINDGEISVEEDDQVLDDEPAKPVKKKSKHR